MDNPRDPASIRDSLEAIGVDRGRIGERMTAETWWAAPAQGLGAALLVGAPAAGLGWAWLLYSLSTAIFIGVEVLFRKRSGLSITRPAGPRGRWLLVAFVLIFCFPLVICLVLALLGLTGWIIAIAVATGVATALLVVEYDRAYAAEVRHAA